MTKSRGATIGILPLLAAVTLAGCLGDVRTGAACDPTNQTQHRNSTGALYGRWTNGIQDPDGASAGTWIRINTG